MDKCSKGRNFQTELLPLLRLPCRKKSGGFTQGGCLLLLDLLLFLVKDFLLHGCKVGGDCTEIGANHLVRYHCINLCSADMLVTEYL